VTALAEGSRPAGGIVRGFGSLAEHVLDQRAQLGKVRLVVVDGPSGAGKTYFARRLSAALRHAPVVHLDHLYEGWDGLADVGPRLDAWVLVPLRSGLPGRHLVYDWRRGGYAEWREVPIAPCVVVEGTGAGQHLVDRHATLRVWVQAPPGLCLARSLARDGEQHRDDLERWQAAEAELFAEDGTRSRADLVVDGAPQVRHDPRGEFVEIPQT
jgi:uridine kinase